MKYYLIIGYRLIEKNKNFPLVRVSVNDNFIDEFYCDNEKNSAIESWHTSSKVNENESYQKKVEYCLNVPAKQKILELDSAAWPEQCNLCIEILKNPSNYSNGFVSKRSLVIFSPIYLIAKSLYNDKGKFMKALHKLFRYRENFFEFTDFPKKYYKNKWAWPGVHDSPVQEMFGGDQKIYFKINKKLNFYYLTGSDSENLDEKGLPNTGLFFYAWANHHLKIQKELTYEDRVTWHNQKSKYKVILNQMSQKNNEK